MNFRLFFLLWSFLVFKPEALCVQISAGIPEIGNDSLQNAPTEDSIKYFAVTDKLVLGGEMRLLNVDYSIFQQMNIQPELRPYFEGLNYWEFSTINNPLSMSYFMASRYGKFQLLSHPVYTNGNSGSGFQSRFIGYGYGFTFKRLMFNASYRQIRGLTRKNYYLNETDTLKNICNHDARVSIELIINKDYTKYGNNVLYIPVRFDYFASFRFESSFFSLRNTQDIIPYISLDTVSSSGNNWVLKLDDSKYVYRLRTYSQTLYMDMGFICPLYKRLNEKPKSLSFKLNGHYGISAYKYYLDSRSNEFQSSGWEIEIQNSMTTQAQLVYNDRFFSTGIGYYLSFITYNSKYKSSDLFVFRYTYQLVSVFFAYRVPFRKGYDYMNRKMKRIKGAIGSL